jgi:hypothetical protein
MQTSRRGGLERKKKSIKTPCSKENGEAKPIYITQANGYIDAEK